MKKTCCCVDMMLTVMVLVPGRGPNGRGGGATETDAG